MAINRKKIVESHNPKLNDFDVPLSVGNGNFAYTADITGLQSYWEEYHDDTPLCTMTHWGVHTTQPGKFTHKDFKMKYFQSNERMIPMHTEWRGQKECYDWLRENPHRLNLARIGFVLDGKALAPEQISGVKQELNIWEGVLYSRFVLDGETVEVETTTHGSRDILGVKVESDLLQQGRLAVLVAFPYGSPDLDASDWTKPEAHSTTICENKGKHQQLLRVLDMDKYFCKFWLEELVLEEQEKHHFLLQPQAGEVSFTVEFSDRLIFETLDFDKVQDSSKKTMKKYWEDGGFVDFSACKDPRAKELARRVILSQYLLKIQSAGDYPPQETGLTVNSWFGKAHLEMHYWHSFHFILFGKPELMEQSMWWYQDILEQAKDLAHSQGFRGARWPKMPWQNGLDSPSGIAPLLIWQQPHPINYVYNIYRAYKARGEEEQALEILHRYRDIVFESAEFMVSFAYYDKENQRYILGPGIIPAQENHKPEITLNPTFELEYWHFGLGLATEMLERIGEKAPEKWTEVREGISPLPEQDGVYLAHENCPATYTEFNIDHPSHLCALGILPGALAKPEIMKASLEKVMEEWTFERLWGWDFPVMAATAARLNMPETAIECLLVDSPKNTYRANGHNQQVPRKDLPLYLPGNGAVLLAIAGMCAGFGDGEELPGFPKDGNWDVRYENILPIL